MPQGAQLPDGFTLLQSGDSGALPPNMRLISPAAPSALPPGFTLKTPPPLTVDTIPADHVAMTDTNGQLQAVHKSQAGAMMKQGWQVGPPQQQKYSTETDPRLTALMGNGMPTQQDLDIGGQEQQGPTMGQTTKQFGKELLTGLRKMAFYKPSAGESAAHYEPAEGTLAAMIKSGQQSAQQAKEGQYGRATVSGLSALDPFAAGPVSQINELEAQGRGKEATQRGLLNAGLLAVGTKPVQGAVGDIISAAPDVLTNAVDVGSRLPAATKAAFTRTPVQQLSAAVQPRNVGAFETAASMVMPDVQRGANRLGIPMSDETSVVAAAKDALKWETDPKKIAALNQVVSDVESSPKRILSRPPSRYVSKERAASEDFKQGRLESLRSGIANSFASLPEIPEAAPNARYQLAASSTAGPLPSREAQPPMSGTAQSFTSVPAGANVQLPPKQLTLATRGGTAQPQPFTVLPHGTIPEQPTQQLPLAAQEPRPLISIVRGEAPPPIERGIKAPQKRTFERVDEKGVKDYFSYRFDQLRGEMKDAQASGDPTAIADVQRRIDELDQIQRKPRSLMDIVGGKTTAPETSAPEEISSGLNIGQRPDRFKPIELPAKPNATDIKAQQTMTPDYLGRHGSALDRARAEWQAQNPGKAVPEWNSDIMRRAGEIDAQMREGFGLWPVEEQPPTQKADIFPNDEAMQDWLDKQERNNPTLQRIKEKVKEQIRQGNIPDELRPAKTLQEYKAWQNIQSMITEAEGQGVDTPAQLDAIDQWIRRTNKPPKPYAAAKRPLTTRTAPLESSTLLEGLQSMVEQRRQAQATTPPDTFAEALRKQREAQSGGFEAMELPQGETLMPGRTTEGEYGSNVKVMTSSGSLPGRYKVVEADSLIPSHDAMTFARNRNYPQGVQERAYDTSKEAQNRVIQQAQEYKPEYTINSNPDAVNGPPVATKDGLVLGGNSRTMSTQRLYRSGGGDLYRNYLLQNAQQFGIKPGQIEGFKDPVLVREIETPASINEARRLGSDLNKSMTGALGVTEKAVSAGRNLKPGTLEGISSMLKDAGEDASLRDVLRTRGRDILKYFANDGVITERERPQFVDTSTGGLNDEGKNFVERALMGSVVDDPRLMDAAPKNVLNKLERSLGDIAQVSTRKDAYNILPLIREAIAEHAELARTGSTVDDYLGQGSIFGAERNPATDAIVKILAGKQKPVGTAFRQFAQDAAFDVQGQGSMLMGEKPSPAAAFNAAFGTHFSEEQFTDALLQSLRREEGVASESSGQKAIAPTPAGSVRKHSAAPTRPGS